MLKKLILFIASFCILSFSTIEASIARDYLKVNTTLSNSIFLRPVSTSRKTIFLDVKSTANDFYLQSALRQRLIGKGYKIVKNSNSAEFILQANLRSVTRSATAKTNNLSTIGGAILGGALGSAFGGGSGRFFTTTAGAVAGGAAGKSLGSGRENITYTAIIDVLISQRTSGRNFKTHRTQIISRANKDNLTRSEATSAIVNDTVSAISGIF